MQKNMKSCIQPPFDNARCRTCGEIFMVKKMRNRLSILPLCGLKCPKCGSRDVENNPMGTLPYIKY